MPTHRKILGIILAAILVGPVCCCGFAHAAVPAGDDAPAAHSCCDSRSSSEVPDEHPCESCSIEMVRSAEAGNTPFPIPRWIELGLIAASPLPPVEWRSLPSTIRMADATTQAPPPRRYLVHRRLLI